MQMGDARAYDFPSIFTVANDHDALVEGEPRTVIGGSFEVTEAPLSILDAINENAAQRVAFQGGSLTLRGPTPPAAVVAIPDNDSPSDQPRILSDQPRSLSWAKNGRNQEILVGQFLDAEADFAPSQTDEVSATGVTPATRWGKRATQSIDFSFVTWKWRVEDTLQFYANDAQRDLSGVVSVPFPYGYLRVGDVVTWDNERHGFDAKEFEVASVSQSLSDGNVSLTLREIDPADRDPVPVE
jgi:hypothetical protein